MDRQLTKRTRNRQQNTPLAYRLKRLGLSLKELEKITGEPYGNLKNWNQGRRRTPKVIFRMLAAWRLLHWGNF